MSALPNVTSGKAPSNATFGEPVIDVVILGSTGSIGTQALEVVSSHPDRFRVVGLAAGGRRGHLLAEQVRQFRPQVVSVARDLGDEGESQQVREAAAVVGAELLAGPAAPAQLAGAFPHATVLNGIDGAVGLSSTLAALDAGSTLALANKESLVAGGALVRRAMQRPAQVVPVDSEHSAIAQALLSGTHNRGMVAPDLDGRSDLHSLVLTASGGPFRGKKRSELHGVTAEQALAHPTWAMGPVVTVNSSTLMNKALELIEASLLFDVPPDRITPVVHPQSIVHSMVTWNDGSTVAQASYPDMKVPIALGMDWPVHLRDIGAVMTWEQPVAWTFEPVDDETFPALGLARAALAASATHPAVLNAANEACVGLFLDGRIDWLSIADTVAAVLDEYECSQDPALVSLEDVLGAQEWAKARARELAGAGL